MTLLLRTLALLAMLVLARDVRAQCLLRVESPSEDVLVSIPCDFWVGVYSRSEWTWTTSDGGAIWRAVPGAVDIAPDGVAFLDDAVWACSIPPGTVVNFLRFALVRGAESVYTFELQVDEERFVSGANVGSPYFYLRSIGGSVPASWDVGSATTVDDVYAGGSLPSTRRVAPFSNPCGTNGATVGTSSGVAFPGGRRVVSETRERTYMDTSGILGGGPGGCLWSSQQRFSSRTLAYDAPNGHFQWVTDPACASLPNPLTAGVDAWPTEVVCELRMYAGPAPSSAAGVFDPGEWMAEPPDVPNLDTSDWFTQPWDSPIGPSITPGAEGGVPDSPLGNIADAMPDSLPNGDGAAPDWVITLPLSEFSPMPDRTVTISFAVWNGMRVLLRSLMIAFCWLSCIRMLWNELSGKAAADA